MNEAEIETKLNRLKSTLAAQAAPSQVENFQRNRNRKLAQATGGDLHFNEAGCYCLIRSVCDGNELLGHTRLGNCKLSRAIPHSAFSYDDNPDSTAVKDLLFFDIESTGLGGAGVVPFLVGIGRFTSEGFEVSQYLLPDDPD